MLPGIPGKSLASISWPSLSLSRIIHKLSAAEPEASGRTALCSFDLLNVLHECACGGLGRDALSCQHFVAPRRYPTIPYE